MVAVCAWLLNLLLRWWRYSHPSARRRRGQHGVVFVPATKAVRTHRKPEWVRRELIRLKALSPELGCRLIAEAFNRRFGERGQYVGKTFVADVLSQSKLDILRMRRDLKHRVPRPTPSNRTWALDLTGKADLSGRQRIILGLLDHGSRACLRLSALADKRSSTILAELVAAIRRFGAPAYLRVDNEACFNSRLMKGALVLLGIRLQTTQPHCPWQNGRIERFFGTLKQRLDRIVPVDDHDLRLKLAQFRCWYNHVRPHQHLAGYTPAEAWDGRRKSIRAPRWYSAWEGLITGWYFPP